MNKQTLFRYRIYATCLVTGLIWLLLVWEYFHGGIPAHHLLADPKLPSISNAWGGLLLPMLAFYLMYRIQKRIQTVEEAKQLTLLRKVLYSFAAAVLFGLSIVLSFSFGYSSISEFLFQAMLLLALIFPLYRAEYYLGFVLALTFSFGAVLPTIIGGVVVLISAASNFGIHPLLIKLKNKFKER